MSALKKILAGSAGLAAVLGLASPAAAQYYLGYGYGYQNGNVGQTVGQAINGVIGALQYGQYPYGNYGYGQSYGYGLDSNMAVDRCARAIEARLNGGGYGGYGYGGGYGQGRVTGIRDIQPRNNGALRVHGYASSYSGYGYGQPNMSFSCKIDRYGRVTELNFDRNTYGYGRSW
ncbi:MAG: hypothetical protein ABR588_06385 [Sphingomicrobium sp.]|nr:hypothetical protein [Sphingomonadales bacterium]